MKLFFACLLCASTSLSLAQQPNRLSQQRSKNAQNAAEAERLEEETSAKIQSGEVWNDVNGKPIQAHGGGIVRFGAYFYWFGEDRAQTLDPMKRYVHCYKSKNLLQWEDRGIAFTGSLPEDMRKKWGDAFVLERPKVFRINMHRFVMYFHLDAGPASRPYHAAEVGVAVSDTVEGPYRFVKAFRPLNQESRDIGQFVDDDGTNYLIFENRPRGGFFIARLAEDGMDVTQTAFLKVPLEGGAIVHYGDLYYMVGSHLTGWKPNPNVYATAKSLSGPWSEFRDVAAPELNTYNSQSSMLLKVKGSKTTTVVYMGDRWNPNALWDSRYVWIPAEIGNGSFTLPQPKPWAIDIDSGEVRYFR